MFLFYVNDIFDFFDAIYTKVTNTTNELIHILLHADDAILLASSKELAVRKVQSLLSYCNINYIIPQYTKFEFIVINGNEMDNQAIPFGKAELKSVDHITI